MIRELTLTNFMRHRSQHLAFAPGLNCIRGANEQGKSTSLKAILYALFGSKALPVSLEDVVTHGQPVNSLRVKLVLDIDGQTYSVERSKTGAEVSYAGGTVTGQTDVTRFLCERMGVDAVAAARLMVAAQGDIRGALEAGPKATTEMIERLSDFDQLDDLITRMQERLTLGSTGPLEDTLAVALQRLEQTEVLPDLKSLEEDTTRAQERLRKLQAQHSTLDDESRRLKGAIQEAKSLEGRRKHFQLLLDDAVFRKHVAEGELGQVQLALSELVAPMVSLSQAQSRIETLRNLLRDQQNYLRVQSLLGQVVPRDPKEIRNEMAQLWDKRKALTERVMLMQGEVAGARAAVLSGLCSFCGQDLSAVPEVVERNKEAKTRVAALEAELARMDAERSELSKREGDLNCLLQDAQELMAQVNSNSHLVAVDPSTRETVWVGPDVRPTEPVDMAQAESDLAAARSHEATLGELMRHMERAKRNLQDAEKALDYPTAELKALEAQTSPVPVQGLEQQLGQVVAQLREIVPTMLGAEEYATEAMHGLHKAQVQAEMLKAQRERDLADVERLQASIKLMSFNNGLLKKVRQARPLIADRLWAVVLTVVSNYFSAMRGQRSVVSKDRDGFKVDGAPVETLSGSTLDILGLALRVALVRTFLPASTFLLLDEPCAAMDNQRTESTLGFLAASGFEQVLLVTHEDVSETVADHIVSLGA